MWVKKTHNNLTNKKHSNFYLLAWVKVGMASFKIKPMKDQRVNLDKMTDLKAEMACPSCQCLLSEPEYKCEHCKIQLVFFVKTI